MIHRLRDNHTTCSSLHSMKMDIVLKWGFEGPRLSHPLMLCGPWAGLDKAPWRVDSLQWAFLAPGQLSSLPPCPAGNSPGSPSASCPEISQPHCASIPVQGACRLGLLASKHEVCVKHSAGSFSPPSNVCSANTTNSPIFLPGLGSPEQSLFFPSPTDSSASSLPPRRPMDQSQDSCQH